jgi:uncharacterized lipoprotein YddW (UPF0748 family)
MKNITVKHLRVSLFCLVVSVTAACAVGKITPTDNSRPLFWTWLNYYPAVNFDSVCAVIADCGIRGVMLHTATPDEFRAAVPVARRHGIRLYAWLWTVNSGNDPYILQNHPDWLSVNRRGESLYDTPAYVNYYKFLCPALPEVREYLRNKVRAYCEIDGLEGVAIDYHRFVDVILPEALWAKYDIVQDKEYPEWDYGYHPAMLEKFQQLHGYDPHAQDDPSADTLWLQFRCDQITECANEIADVVHSFGKTMAASPFPTPSMSKKMVRQEWNKWNLDIVFPMVYHIYYTGTIDFIEECNRENAATKRPSTALYCGLIALDSPEIFRCMDAALNNGAEGIAIFTVNSLRTPELRQSFRAYTDSVRAQRSRSQFGKQINQPL